jgi:hypothetical protein
MGHGYQAQAHARLLLINIYRIKRVKGFQGLWGNIDGCLLIRNDY